MAVSGEVLGTSKLMLILHGFHRYPRGYRGKTQWPHKLARREHWKGLRDGPGGLPAEKGTDNRSEDFTAYF
jgi:hypothetical protein